MQIAELLPHLNASLNALAAGFLLLARLRIHQRRIAEHRRAMLAALFVSALFLAGYLSYHHLAPIFVFRGRGAIRSVYYTLLISHVLLAALALPLILRTAWLGWHRADAKHRRWARFTWPLWMYVSVSGVLVYLLLYRVTGP